MIIYSNTQPPSILGACEFDWFSRFGTEPALIRPRRRQAAPVHGVLTSWEGQSMDLRQQLQHLILRHLSYTVIGVGRFGVFFSKIQLVHFGKMGPSDFASDFGLLAWSQLGLAAFSFSCRARLHCAKRIGFSSSLLLHQSIAHKISKSKTLQHHKCQNLLQRSYTYRTSHQKCHRWIRPQLQLLKQVSAKHIIVTKC